MFGDSGLENVQQGSTATVSKDEVRFSNSLVVACQMTFELKAITQEGKAIVISSVLIVNGVSSTTEDTVSAF